MITRITQLSMHARRLIPLYSGLSRPRVPLRDLSGLGFRYSNACQAAVETWFGPRAQVKRIKPFRTRTLKKRVPPVCESLCICACIYVYI